MEEPGEGIVPYNSKGVRVQQAANREQALGKHIKTQHTVLRQLCLLTVTKPILLTPAHIAPPMQHT